MAQKTLGQINESLMAQLRNTPAKLPEGGPQPLNEQMQQYAKLFQQELAAQRDGYGNMSVSQFNQFYVLTAYTSIHQRVAEKLQKIYNSVDGIRDFYLVEVMLAQLTEDALAPKIGTEEVIKFSHRDPKVLEFLNDMKVKVGLDQLIENITPDLCAYGDYVVETDVKPSIGLVGLYDNVEQGKTIPLIQDGKTNGYLHVDEVNNDIVKKELADFVHFSLGGQRVKVRFDNTLPLLLKNNAKLREFFKKTPKYLRIGRSMIYPVLGKLRELELLEKLVPATKINKLSQGNTIGVPVPESFDLQRGFEAAKQVENNINRKVMIDNTMKEVTVEAILSTAGRTRVIPIFGEKGRLEKVETRGDEADDLFSNCKELRELICDSIGVPSELVFKNNDGSKNDLLKRYAKYLRKLKRIQKAIIEGARQVVAIHLANSDKYKDVDPESVEIILNNHLVEIDNLDRLEHADITISFTKNVTDFFNSLNEEGSVFKPYVKMSKVLEFIGEQLKTIGLADALDTNQEKVTSGEITQGQADELDNQEDAAMNPERAGAEKTKDDKEFPDLPFDPSKNPDDKSESRRTRVNERRHPAKK